MPETIVKDHPECRHCSTRSGAKFQRELTMAFQPIVDIENKRIFAQEALVRGTDGAGAGEVLSEVTDDNKYHFDQKCRTIGIEIAARLDLDTVLSLNFLPNAVYEPATCIRKTLEAADRHGFDPKLLMFEMTEQEAVNDIAHLKRIFEDYSARGFRTAIDDFGAGYAGLGLLAELQPDYIKIDRVLIAEINGSPARQAIFRGIVGTASHMDIDVIAEGVETDAELDFVCREGVKLIQGYRIARPRLEGLVTADEVDWPSRLPDAAA